MRDGNEYVTAGSCLIGGSRRKGEQIMPYSNLQQTLFVIAFFGTYPAVLYASLMRPIGFVLFAIVGIAIGWLTVIHLVNVFVRGKLIRT